MALLRTSYMADAHQGAAPAGTRHLRKAGKEFVHYLILSRKGKGVRFPGARAFFSLFRKVPIQSPFAAGDKPMFHKA
jgi:hypothetical protein